MILKIENGGNKDFYSKLPSPHLENGCNVITTQQDYYGRWCSTLLHSCCNGTYTEVTELNFWGSSAVTMEYLHSYSVEVPVWVLKGNSRATLKEQHCYFCVGTRVVTMQWGTTSPAIVICVIDTCMPAFGHIFFTSHTYFSPFENSASVSALSYITYAVMSCPILKWDQVYMIYARTS